MQNLVETGNQMEEYFDNGFNKNRKNAIEKEQKLSEEWYESLRRFLPIEEENSVWLYSRATNSDDPEQGWKLHIAATIFTAAQVLEKVAPVLISENVQFKTPNSLQELAKINNGLHYGYSQVGKFITVYPPTTEDAVRLADCLDELTKEIDSPSVPFDEIYKPNSCVFYRYGAFKYQEIEDENGKRIAAVRNSSGELVPDLREVAKPEGDIDPFRISNQTNESEKSEVASPLRTKYRVFRAITQRGKGGVYQAIDIEAEKPRLCIVKEGRRFGEVRWDGLDGFDLVKYEEEVLKSLRQRDVDVPIVYSSFEVQKNYYLVTENIEGKSLHSLLRTRQRRFSVKQVLKYALQTAEILTKIHKAGWVWFDCKPANLIVTKDGLLRPIDFEGACRIGGINAIDWSTTEFSSIGSKEVKNTQSIVAEDIYGLGAVTYFLLTGRFYDPNSPIPIKKLRRGIPSEIQKIVDKLVILPVQRKRPSAKVLVSEFERLLKNISKK